jgi:hypothetical protein
MEHVLQLKQLVIEMEALKVKKLEQSKSKVNKETNVLEHKRKLHTIKFVDSSTRQKEKENELKRRQLEKQSKLQGGSDSMEVLHDKLCKQVVSNGGIVPNLGTTPLPLVSH